MRLLSWLVYWPSVALAILTGFITGWIPTHVTWFRTVSADDYLISVGGYLASVFVLLAAAAAIEAFSGPANARRVAIAFAALFSFLSLRATFVLHHGPTSKGLHSVPDGIEMVLVMPWSLLLLATGAIGWILLLRRRRAFDPRLAA